MTTVKHKKKTLARPIAGTVKTLSAGRVKGFDANVRVTAADAKAFYKAGYQFAVRYVRRAPVHDFDLTRAEAQDILAAGLGLMLVQHVAPDNWNPTGALGTTYGKTAAAEAKGIGIPSGVTLWCDLEIVNKAAKAEDVIAYCNNWHAAVAAAGYTPGLYVGYQPGLDAQQLYTGLRFVHYWGAYNADLVPARRGFQMKQYAMKSADRVASIAYEFDVNYIVPDTLGGAPLVLMP